MTPEEYAAALQALQLRVLEARAREAEADAGTAELKREEQRLLNEAIRAQVERGRRGQN